MLSTFLLLGLLVMVLGAMTLADEANRWSSVIAHAADTGALQNEAFAARIQQMGLLQSPFARASVAAGLAICAVAIWRLIIETRR